MENNIKIKKIRKNEEGQITDLMTDDGEIFPMNHAIMLARDHKIEGIGVFKGENGGEFLVPESDILGIDNLNDLPKFK